MEGFIQCLLGTSFTRLTAPWQLGISLKAYDLHLTQLFKVAGVNWCEQIGV